MGHLVKTEKGEDREHDNDETDEINDTVHELVPPYSPNFESPAMFHEQRALRSSAHTGPVVSNTADQEWRLAARCSGRQQFAIALVTIRHRTKQR